MPKRVDLIDLGYVDEQGRPVDIEGRDNITQKFMHLGYVYPDGVVIDEAPGQYVIIEDEPNT